MAAIRIKLNSINSACIKICFIIFYSHLILNDIKKLYLPDDDAKTKQKPVPIPMCGANATMQIKATKMGIENTIPATLQHK